VPAAVPLRIGLLADVQFADKPDEGPRRYRAALGGLERAVARLNAAAPDLVVQLGDLVDGREREEDTAADLDRVLAVLGGLEAPLLHVVGNHCLALPRERLLARLGLATAWYERAWLPWRLLVLDAQDLSVCGWPAGSPEHRRGQAWLAAHPAGGHPQALPWNGGLGEEQLAWLAGELAEAGRAGETVLVFCHMPVWPGAGRPSHLLWNHADVLELMARFPGVVAAWVAGHDHVGGQEWRRGVLHLTLPGLVEADPAAPPVLVLGGWPDRLELNEHPEPG